MTDEQFNQLLEYARQRIAFNLQKLQVRTGNGVNSTYDKGKQVIFLDPVPRRRPFEREQPPWGVAIAGYTEFVNEVNIVYPPPTPPEQYTTTTVSGDSTLLAANAWGITTNQIVDRIAFYQTQQPPASGYVAFKQTIYMRVLNYSFPVRVTFRVTDVSGTGNQVVSQQEIDFTSPAERTLLIERVAEGQRLVTAVSVTRL